jgi:hypothetical protein
MNVWEKHWAFGIVTQYLRDTLRPSTPEYRHEYYIRHKSEILKYQTEYRIKNRERIRARQKEFRQSRCGQLKSLSSRRRMQGGLELA